MPYNEVFWTPDQDSPGEEWRRCYNEHMGGEFSYESYIRWLQTEASPAGQEIVERNLPAIKLGLAIRQESADEVLGLAVKRAKGWVLSRRSQQVATKWLQNELKRFLCSNEGGYFFKSNHHSFDLFSFTDLVLKDGLFRDHLVLSDLLTAMAKARGAKRKMARSMVRAFVGSAIQSQLDYLEARMIKAIAEKTWDNPDGPDEWTRDEFGCMARYFSRWHYSLECRKESGAIDPHTIFLSRQDSLRSLAPDALHNLHCQVVEVFVTSFLDELLSFNRNDAQKGTAHCAECGRFFARSFYGHNQKYCTQQCKDRAAKRRQRKGNARGKRRP